MPWALAWTDDFVNYTDHGVVLPSGGPDAADYNCYTGCVIDDGDQMHLFYTGHNPARRTTAGDLQVVCHATSDGDLTSWHRHPDHTFGRTVGLPARGLARPVRVSRRTGRTVAVGTGRRDAGGPDRRCGVVARLTSTDLAAWHLTSPLWILIASSPRSVPRCSGGATGGISSNRNSPTPSRPDTASPLDRTVHGWRRMRTSVDGRARYASKSVARGDRRFFVGWIATRAGERDDGGWEWAGELAALEATQGIDGTLEVRAALRTR